MLKSIATYILLGIIGVVSVFGFLTMSATNHSDMSMCFMSIGVQECSMEVTAFNIQHHINSLQALSETTISSLFAFALLLFAVGSLFFYVFSKNLFKNFYIKQQVLLSFFHQRLQHPFVPLQKIYRWIAVRFSRNPHKQKWVRGFMVFLYRTEHVFTV